MNTLKWIGIDYGSKLAGTTVIVYQKEGQFFIKQSLKKEDADQMIINFLKQHNVEYVFIDAPLSLPSAYFGKGENYFYRKADQETQAMSPMFLGGLTARAMKLKSSCSQSQFLECYPKLMVNEILQLEGYNKKSKFGEEVLSQASLSKHFKELPEISNWHQFDALMAWETGRRYLIGNALCYGDQSEGLIWV